MVSKGDDEMSILRKFPHKSDCTCHVCNPLRYEDNGMSAKVTTEERASQSSQKLHKIGGGYVSKEWSKLFLSNWNRAVEMWNEGYIFSEEAREANSQYTIFIQQEYARICCAWLIPNEFQEPHVEACNIHPDCTCSHCVAEQQEEQFSSLLAYREFQQMRRES